MPRILLTGGGGYIGCHLAKTLRTQGIDHLIIDDFSTGHAAPLAGSSWLRTDIRDEKNLRRIFSEYQPQVVIHLAALATLGDCAARPDDARQINIDGTRHLLDAMAAYGVHALIFASSCAVYNATAPGIRLNESVALSPASLYGQTKLTGEKLLAEYYTQHGICSVALRLFNVAGADPDGTVGENHHPETHLLPLAIAAALKGGILNIFGNDYPTEDGTAVRDYVHVCDVAAACMQSMAYLQNGGRPVALNLGSRTSISVRQLITAVEKHTGSRIASSEKPLREGDAPWLVADTALLRRTLDWQPQLSTLDNIIETALRWHCRS